MIKNSLLLLCATMFLPACVETIVMDPGEKDLPVMVSCILDPDLMVQTLYLQYVKGKSAQEYVPIENARVYMTQRNITGTNSVIDFQNVSGNRWETVGDQGRFLIDGRAINLFVEIPGHAPLFATTTIPERKWLNMRVFDSYDDGIDNAAYMFGLNMDDMDEDVVTPPVWIVATKGKHDKSESRIDHYAYLATDCPFADDFNVSGILLADLHIDDIPDNIYAQQRWPLFYNIRRMKPELPLHKDFIHLGHLDRQYYHIIAGPIEQVRSNKQDHYDFLFVSEELDEYLKCAYQKNGEQDHDLTKLYSTENAYSNIEGGVGIFGAFVCKDDYIWI